VTADVIASLLRLAHTLKGAARVVRQTAIAEQAHAIEDALAPLREPGATISAEWTDQVLKRLDVISGNVTALEGAPRPEGSPAEASSAASSGGDAPTRAGVSSTLPVTSVRADVAEMDSIIDGLAETSVQLRALRGTAAIIERAHKLADELAMQAAHVPLADPRRAVTGGGSMPAAAGALRMRSSTEELRSVLGELERRLVGGIDQTEREVRQVRDAAERLRLLSADSLLATLERAARDAARSLQKEVVFAAKGGDVRLDASVLAALQGALVQLVRNAVAHGIEPPDERTRAGKSPTGRIEVAVVRRGNSVVFTCRDDGRGVDLDAVRRAAAASGRLPRPAGSPAVDRQHLLDLLLQGGLTTSGALTEISGRGVGLDIVREACARLGGRLTVATDPGAGTRFDLTVPVSISAIEALVAESGGIKVALPLQSVRGILRVTKADVARTAEGDSIVHGGQAIPLLPLAALVARGGAARVAAGVGPWTVAVVAAGDGSEAQVAAVSLERLLGTARVVVRLLPPLAPADPIAVGAALDFEGIPQIVLDPARLVAAARRMRGASMAAEVKPAPSVLVIDDSLTTRMLEQSILESAGYEVDLAVSAEEGLEKARLRRYQLFLVDVEMPGMDGFTFVERTRADPVLRSTPAILVTSRNAAADKQRGEDAGARAYIVKGEFNQDHLLQTIRELVA
jgi:two-component system chemotaxis sensor kinase CheA